MRYTWVAVGTYIRINKKFHIPMFYFNYMYV